MVHADDPRHRGGVRLALEATSSCVWYTRAVSSLKGTSGWDGPAEVSGDPFDEPAAPSTTNGPPRNMRIWEHVLHKRGPLNVAFDVCDASSVELLVHRVFLTLRRSWNAKDRWSTKSKSGCCSRRGP
eukprot:134113-Pyramimonas_sp.AAC.3